MASVVGELILKAMMELVKKALSQGALDQLKGTLRYWKIKNAVDKAVIEVTEPLADFLGKEGVREEKFELLVSTAEAALEPLVKEPAALFRGSLDGSKIFQQLYGETGLPQEIREEGLEGVFELLVPRMAAVLCRLLPVIEKWELEGWKENYRRLDEIVEQLRGVLGRLDADAARTAGEADELLRRARRTILQRSGLMDLTGLRAESAMSCGFEALFVHPELEDNRRPKARVIRSGEEAIHLLLAASARSVILGGPGAGKSTLLLWLERAGSEAGWGGVIVRLTLRELLRGSELPTWIAALQQAAGAHLKEEIDAPTAKRWRDGGALCFLVDGFDEVPADRRGEVKGWLIGLSEALGRCPLVLTSRPLTTDHLESLGSPWSTWTVNPFDKGRVLDYIQRWYSHVALPPEVDRNVDATALASTWRQDPTIGPLTGNPLLLATLLLVHALDGSLPAGRAKLYQRYVEGMLGVWDQRQQRPASMVALTTGQKREILRDLALRMFLEEVDQLEDTAVEAIVASTLERLRLSCSPTEALDVLRERTGLIVGPGIWTFSHKSVAEFLVAEAIVDGTVRDHHGKRMDRMRLFRHRYEDRWNVVTFLWAGLAPPVELEGFLEELGRDGDVERASELAIGLMSDQEDRSTRDQWRFWMARLSGMAAGGGEANFVCELGERARTPHRLLRTISGRNLSTFALRRLSLRDLTDVLQYLDPAVSKSPEVWWLVATSMPSHPQWTSALRNLASLQPNEESQDRVIVAASWAIGPIVELATSTQERLMSQLREFWPLCRLGLALEVSYARALSSLSSLESLKFVLLQLSCTEIDNTPDRWLSNAHLRRFRTQRRIPLATLVSDLHHAVSTGELPDDDATRRAIANAGILHQRQAALFAAHANGLAPDE